MKAFYSLAVCVLVAGCDVTIPLDGESSGPAYQPVAPSTPTPTRQIVVAYSCPAQTRTFTTASAARHFAAQLNALNIDCATTELKPGPYAPNPNDLKAPFEDPPTSTWVVRYGASNRLRTFTDPHAAEQFAFDLAAVGCTVERR